MDKNFATQTQKLVKDTNTSIIHTCSRAKHIHFAKLKCLYISKPRNSPLKMPLHIQNPEILRTENSIIMSNHLNPSKGNTQCFKT